MEIKHFHLHDIKADAESRTVEGGAPTSGNVDSDDEVIAPGAVTDSAVMAAARRARA